MKSKNPSNPSARYDAGELRALLEGMGVACNAAGELSRSTPDDRRFAIVSRLMSALIDELYLGGEFDFEGNPKVFAKLEAWTNGRRVLAPGAVTMQEQGRLARVKLRRLVQERGGTRIQAARILTTVLGIAYPETQSTPKGHPQSAAARNARAAWVEKVYARMPIENNLRAVDRARSQANAPLRNETIDKAIEAALIVFGVPPKHARKWSSARTTR